MSMSLIDFESSRKKEQQRQFEREARQAILDKAKSKYEAEQQKKEEARQRGEHTWMLSSVESKLHTDKKKKKKDKKKKKKKEKKAKKSKRKDSSSSSSSESEEEDMWVESTTGADKSSNSKSGPAPPTSHQTTTTTTSSTSTENEVKRQEWMEMTSLFKTYSREQIRELDGTSRKKAKEEEEKRKREEDKPGSHARELNPFFKDGGSGLPEEKRERSEPGTGAGPSPIVDAAWLRKAMRRAQEQAQQEGRPLAEIVAVRWGSLEKFNELLAQAERRDRRGGGGGGWQSQERMNKRSSRSKERYGDDRRHDWRRGSDEGRNDDKRGGKTHTDKPSDKQDKRRTRSRSRERRSRSVERRRQRRHSSSSSSSSNSRSRSKERKERRRSRSAEKKDRRRNSRSRSKERRGRRRLSSSRSSSSSSSSSRSRNRGRRTDNKPDRKPRVQGLLKPHEDFQSERRTSSLNSRFLKPGEDGSDRFCGVQKTPASKSGRGWQKKEYRPPPPDPKPQRKESSSSSSSSSLSESEEEEKAGGGRGKTSDTTNKPGSSSMSGDGNSGAPSNKPTPAPTPTRPPLTDKEMNELAAKIMKAELIGNDVQAEKLKVKLESARTARANRTENTTGDTPGEGDSLTKEQVVVLTRMDHRGVCRPVVEAEERGGKRKKGTGSKTHGKDGQRERYFPDDDARDLKSMFEQEKGTTAEDQNEMFQHVASQAGEVLDDDYDLDDMFMSKVATKETTAKQAERDRLKAIQEHKRAERSLESCQWCFDNKEMPKHLIVALGTKCYVCLPPHQSLTPGHCLIVPIHHVPCSVQADEDLWSEVQSFRKSLVKMFNSRDEDCVFFETVKRLRHFPHMALSCVPLPREEGDMAPIYFKKAILECEKEWAQNKKLVDLRERDVRHSVPKGLPYFFVDFGMQSGFAHVIEDEQDFPNNFAQEIVGGMLDLERNLWRKPRKENFDIQRRKVMEFSRWYKEFDPTQEEG
ncbi:hypothetical protein Pcinc_025533 [Petrolisthes cinctipes]|uniref:CWF19-like protein 2 n=1 Tax=Petrolisthes cinctipes TaxID=88211 RepID=A0AAE1KBG5_PETCI|nr:hypothetical protein Pcinc_025533 [Petrolisthes cinctipes]